MEKIIIDVREKDEYLAEHIAGSISLPLTDFGTHAADLLTHFRDKEMIFMCRSGQRAQMAVDTLAKLKIGLQHPVEVYVGGIMQWKAAGHPVVQAKTTYLPILRQVHLIAGTLVVLSLVLGLLFSQKWLALGLVVGSGLMVAGATGFCGMALLLAKMPWNKCATRPMVSEGCHVCQL